MSAAEDPALAFGIVEIICHVAHWPLEKPVLTSFGAMTERPLLLVQVIGTDGVQGWGEVWCNFPAIGAKHRAGLIATILKPLVVGREFEAPIAALEFLTESTETLAIQSGEEGPLAQAIAGIDVAIWDMLARRAGMPLYRFLGAGERASVPVYASGIGGEWPEEVAARKREEGHTRFKLKVGFGRESDLRNLSALRDRLGPDASIMVDANQAWPFDVAVEMAAAMARFRPAWLEEPIRATAAPSTWAALAKATPVPLANGENLRGRAEFAGMVTHGAIRFLQPDVGKWGGVTGCLQVAKFAISHGATYCPHWLGGGIGLIASMHVLAAAGGFGVIEVDANPNPFRDELIGGLPVVEAGEMPLPLGPGLGVKPELRQIEQFRTPL